jgi:hypothetical protein
MKYRDIGLGKSNRRIGQQRQPHGSGHELAQEFEPFSADLDAQRSDARDVSARPVQAGDEPDPNRIRTRAEDDRNGRGQSFQSQCRCRGPWCGDGCNIAVDEIGGQFRPSVILTSAQRYWIAMFWPVT